MSASSIAGAPTAARRRSGTVPAPGAHRVTKREFVDRVSRRSGWSPAVVSEVYEAVLDEIRESIAVGDVIVLTGFGRFYRQNHKGHEVHFGRTTIKAYPVLKFSASRSANHRVHALMSERAACRNEDLAGEDPDDEDDEGPPGV